MKKLFFKYINKNILNFYNLDITLLLFFVLKNFLKNKKNNYEYFYFDIGSSHPIILNITRYFYEYGYKGICIDPRNFKNLYKKKRAEDIFINRAFSTKQSEYLYILKNQQSILKANSATISKKYFYKLKYEKKYQLRKIKVKTCDARFIYNLIKTKNLEIINVPLVKIDAEGSDLMIIKNLINFGFRIGCIVIEDKNINLSNIRKSKIFKFLKKKNFLPLLKTLENTIYINLKFKEFNFLPKKMLKF